MLLCKAQLLLLLITIILYDYLFGFVVTVLQT